MPGDLLDTASHQTVYLANSSKTYVDLFLSIPLIDDVRNTKTSSVIYLTQFSADAFTVRENGRRHYNTVQV